jgi:pimeloyl-ACP methyl ester carboxylesterase
MPKIKAGSIDLNYETFGQGDPLLLIMGFGLPGAAWAPTLPFMAGFNCVYFDNRGTGNSDKPDGPYTIHAMAEDASNLLRALGIEKAGVYGVSMGGMIAQELTLHHPEQVSKLVLGCTMAGGPQAARPSDEIVQKLVTGFEMMPTNMSDALDVMMPLLMPPEFIAAHPEIKQLMSMGFQMAPPTPPATLERTITGITEFDAYDRLPQIKCPVLIVHGDKDVLVPPANAEIIKGKLPQAEVFIVPNAGHAFSVSDPVGVHNRIVTWLKS